MTLPSCWTTTGPVVGVPPRREEGVLQRPTVRAVGRTGFQGRAWSDADSAAGMQKSRPPMSLGSVVTNVWLSTVDVAAGLTPLPRLECRKFSPIAPQ